MDPAKIINAYLKDLQMREQIQKLCFDFAERVLPPLTLFKYRNLIAAINDLFYYASTYASAGLSLGEIYCGIK